MDEAERYLSLTARVKQKHFARGHVAATEPPLGAAERGTSACPTPHDAGGAAAVAVVGHGDPPPIVRRVPPKRRKRSDDDDDDVYGSGSCAVATAPLNGDQRGACPPSDPPVPGPAEARPSPSNPASGAGGSNKPAPISLLEKWFPGNTLQQGTLDVSQAPSTGFIEATVARMCQARERFVAMRMAVEDIVAGFDQFCALQRVSRWSSAGLSGAHSRDSLIEAYVAGINCSEKRELMEGAFDITCRSRAGVQRAVRWLLQEEPRRATGGGDGRCSDDDDDDGVSDLRNGYPGPAAVVLGGDGDGARRGRAVPVPTTSSLRAWHEYVAVEGPHTGKQLPLSLLLFLDSACSTALLSVLVTKTLRGARNKDTTRNEEDTAEAGKLFVNDEHPAALEDDGAGEEAPTLASRVINDFPTRFAPSVEAHGNQQELLRFLRYLLPITVLDGSGHAVGPLTVGYGSWLYSSLVSVDLPLDPATERLIYDLFRTCCKHVRTISDFLQNVEVGQRGAMVEAIAARAAAAPPPPRPGKQYWTLDDVGKEELLALHTLIVVLAKVFRQNQNNMIPL